MPARPVESRRFILLAILAGLGGVLLAFATIPDRSDKLPVHPAAPTQTASSSGRGFDSLKTTLPLTKIQAERILLARTVRLTPAKLRHRVATYKGLLRQNTAAICTLDLAKFRCTVLVRSGRSLRCCFGLHLRTRADFRFNVSRARRTITYKGYKLYAP